MAVLVMLSAALFLGLFLPSSMANNVLLGDEKLFADEFLTEEGYKFIMRKSDCNLALIDPNDQQLWATNTNDDGQNCFARMQTDGNLVIFNDERNGVWESRTHGPEGKYILVLQRDGHVVIYSSPVWTIPNDEPTNRKIAMATKN
ncbi:mannose-specific lectin-like [Zingiber officinale]|uniref:Bulb-type lectin domain-containing protein n=1 Tax=Zingiber officinale TaxID=94328 RepID=A0A8J5K7F5_ZINOF|nr:mannose-specific lectin-like [Zingiber officinale]KAG6476834.1 hypothetical protein ZIOFF_066082 [Zingiber officinale]